MVGFANCQQVAQGAGNTVAAKRLGASEAPEPRSAAATTPQPASLRKLFADFTDALVRAKATAAVHLFAHINTTAERGPRYLKSDQARRPSRAGPKLATRKCCDSLTHGKIGVLKKESPSPQARLLPTARSRRWPRRKSSPALVSGKSRGVMACQHGNGSTWLAWI